ncbi:hypothetical protein [Streptomyces sp. NPDC002133]|uniref:hypothetical protein n=1 Tax=Streptomyces sp. NPDC002133 TaxID=3154409 RepID=UPI003325052B
MTQLHLLYDRDFREQAGRAKLWGAVLLGVAGLLWVWFAVLLFTPYQFDDGYSDPVNCDSPFFTDRSDANAAAAEGSSCVAERDWPELLAVLGGSVPFAVTGTVLYTTGAVSKRISEHAAEIARLKEADA